MTGLSSITDRSTALGRGQLRDTACSCPDRGRLLEHSENRLLARLSALDYHSIRPLLTAVELPHRQPLDLPNVPIEQVYFLTRGMGSTVAVSHAGARLEVGVFGREGMSGWPVVLGDDRTPNESFMQMPGAGERIAVADLRKVLETSASMRLVLGRYVQAFMIQAQCTALSNGRGKLEERLSRWLLMCHDRGDGDNIAITHEFLALMLGVRRTGVTLALHMLEGRGLIRSRRGSVHIADRDGLIENAMGSYGTPEAEYARLLG